MATASAQSIDEREESQTNGVQVDLNPASSAQDGGQSQELEWHGNPSFPCVLILDMTRIGDGSATGQMKAVLFANFPQQNLLQVYVREQQSFGLHFFSKQPTAHPNLEKHTDADRLLSKCRRFAPDVLYYRPVADQPFFHDFACAAIETLGTPIVIHIVDDWMERLRRKDPDLYARFDQSLQRLLHQAFARLSICQAMSIALQERYGVEFVSIANSVDPEDWLATQLPTEAKRSDRPFTIRYVGSLADDMTFESVLDVAKAIAVLRSERAVKLEIYTRQLWRDKIASFVDNLPGVSLHDAEFSPASYRQLLMDADALLIAYNFDPASIAYVRYSMANKFPECLASGSPVIVYGSMEIATVSYAAATGCTELVTEQNPVMLKNAIRSLIDHADRCKTLGQSARNYAFEHHSTQQMQHRFYALLQGAAQSKPLYPPVSMQLNDIPEQQNEQQNGQLIWGGYERSLSAHIDETLLIAELLNHLPQTSVMVDVGAHFGSALKPFAQKGWHIFAYEPDPDNRQILNQQAEHFSHVRIDSRAISHQAGETLSLYGSQESTGISTLTPFRDSHTPKCQIVTTTVAQICAEQGLSQIDFLKIDTEGYDLMVLQGVPWTRIQPDVIECEFEDQKTVPLGYTFHDMAQYLVDRRYTVLVSEWHPVIQYGIRHDWHRLVSYPCRLSSPQAWGNLLAFKQPPDLAQIAVIAQKLVKTQAPTSTHLPEHQSHTAIEGQNGMNVTNLKEHHQQSNSGNLDGKMATPIQENIPSIANHLPAPQTEQPTVPEPSATQLATGLLGRIGRYYRRWPLGVAVLAAALNTVAMLDGIPYRWAFSGGGSILLLFLVGHAASKADFSLEVGNRAQETANRAQETADRAQKVANRIQTKATSALKKANHAIEQIESAMSTLNTATEIANSSRETANQSMTTAKFSVETATRTTKIARSAIDRANQATETAESALKVSNQAIANAKSTAKTAESIVTATQQTDQAVSALEQQVIQALQKNSNSSNIRLFQPFERQLSQENLETFVDFWLPTLNLQLDRRALGYLAHRLCLDEDACSGRLATTVQDMLLRILVARSLKSHELSVLEIGSLFGINLAILYDTCREHFETVRLNAIDPLDGYYGKSRTDLITNVPVTRKIFEHNMRQVDVPAQDITLIQGLSTEAMVLEKAGLQQYNLLIIDGDHSYEGIKFDFDHYCSAVNLGGYILFDDYGSEDWPEVGEFVDQEVRSNPCVEWVGSSWRTAVFRVIRRNLG